MPATQSLRGPHEGGAAERLRPYYRGSTGAAVAPVPPVPLAPRGPGLSSFAGLARGALARVHGAKAAPGAAA